VAQVLIALIRAICLGLVRLFYSRVRVAGGERLPATGPAIVVANHPNGLIDPVIVGIALQKRVHFLAKSTLFGTWLGRQAMAAFSAVPVYRAKEADTSQNEKTFAACRAIMNERGWLALFPEGTSHSEPQLQPLKTGAARIALSAEAQSGFTLSVTVVPVGLTYDDKETFRSAVTASVGAPFRLSDYRAAFEADEIAAAKLVTQEIERRLREVVLEADDRTLWQGFRFVARWLSAKQQGVDPEALARQLSQAYRRRVEEAPDEIAALVRDARKLSRMLGALGIPDPFALDLRAHPLKLAWYALLSVLLAPMAAVGAALAWIPYRITGVLAPKLTKGETDLTGTIKALLGLVLIGGAYVAETIAAGVSFGWRAALFMIIFAPFSGWWALRYSEWLLRRRQMLGTIYLRVGHERLLAKIEAERARFCERIAAALDRA
jgi:1-acyl-sn-glycerol-3-phosphate acyltransferase